MHPQSAVHHNFYSSSGCRESSIKLLSLKSHHIYIWGKDWNYNAWMWFRCFFGWFSGPSFSRVQVFSQKPKTWAPDQCSCQKWLLSFWCILLHMHIDILATCVLCVGTALWSTLVVLNVLYQSSLSWVEFITKHCSSVRHQVPNIWQVWTKTCCCVLMKLLSLTLKWPVSGAISIIQEALDAQTGHLSSKLDRWCIRVRN